MWKNKNKLNKELLTHIGLVSQLGLTVVSAILISFFVFLYLDRKFHTDGILIIVGVLMGVFSGLLAAYKLLKKFYKKNE